MANRVIDALNWGVNVESFDTMLYAEHQANAEFFENWIIFQPDWTINFGINVWMTMVLIVHNHNWISTWNVWESSVLANAQTHFKTYTRELIPLFRTNGRHLPTMKFLRKQLRNDEDTAMREAFGIPLLRSSGHRQTLFHPIFMSWVEHPIFSTFAMHINSWIYVDIVTAEFIRLTT